MKIGFEDLMALFDSERGCMSPECETKYETLYRTLHRLSEELKDGNPELIMEQKDREYSISVSWDYKTKLTVNFIRLYNEAIKTSDKYEVGRDGDRMKVSVFLKDSRKAGDYEIYA